MEDRSEGGGDPVALIAVISLAVERHAPRRFLNRHEAYWKSSQIGNPRIAILDEARSNREIPPVFSDESFPGVEREISRWDGFNPKNHHGRIYLGENAFSAQNRNDKLLLSLSIASVSLVFLSRTIVSIYIYFHRTTTTSFLPGESLDPPQFRPILTSIERFGVIRCCIPRRGDEFRSNRGSFYFVRHVYIIRAASMRTQECIHRRRRSGWVKINCSELQLCMESVSGWSVIFNALI